jgi:hypothetical protein
MFGKPGKGRHGTSHHAKVIYPNGRVNRQNSTDSNQNNRVSRFSGNESSSNSAPAKFTRKDSIPNQKRELGPVREGIALYIFILF